MQDRMTKFNSMIARVAEQAGFEVIVNPYCGSDGTSGFDIQRPDSFDNHIEIWVDENDRYFLKCNNMFVVDADSVNPFWWGGWAEDLNRFIAAYKACLLQAAKPAQWDNSMASIPVLRWTSSALVPGQMRYDEAFPDYADVPDDDGIDEALEEKSLDQTLAEINDILEQQAPASPKGFRASLMALIGR